MTVDLKQRLYLRVELDGTGGVIDFEGDMRSCTIQALQYLMQPSTRWVKRDGHPQMLWTWSKSPFASNEKTTDSALRQRNEIFAGLDLTDVETLDDETIDGLRKPWLSDPRIQRLIQINTIREEFENSMPSERVELIQYAKQIWPEFWGQFTLKHLA